MNTVLPLHRPEPDCIDAALQRLETDPGALFEHLVLNALTAVRQTDPARYQRVRAAAKGKASVGELDKLTTPKNDDHTTELCTDVEPCQYPVDGAAMLTAICDIIAKHVIADPPTIRATVLWIAHTYCMDVLTVSPIAHITSPEKRCGKTVLLTAMMRLVHRPLSVANISPAAIFRAVEEWTPTLGMDEVDTYLDNVEAHGLINSGLYRENAKVIRCVGDDHTPMLFSVWAPKILCGIGKLTGTIEDRSIPLRMRRKVKGEIAANIRRSDPRLWDDLKAQLTRWVNDHRSRIAAAQPAPAAGLGDRAQDCWEPLFTIADEAGGEWPRWARAAAVALHGVEEETPSIGIELLRDMEAAFKDHGSARLASRELLGILIGNEEAPWATWNHGKPLTARQLAARLSEFGIKPKTTRLPNGLQLKGYAVEDFDDAFRRYLFAEGDKLSVPPSKPHGSAICEVSASVPGDMAGRFTKAPEPAWDKACNGGTDKNAVAEKKEEGGTGMEVFDL